MKPTLSALPLAAAAAFLLFADIKVDYDHYADFSRYKTYSWIGVTATDSLWEDRIMRAIDQQLLSKGWIKVPSGGDAAVAAFGSTQNRQTLETFYNDFGPGWGWRGGFGSGIATTQVINTPVGTLVVDIFEGQSKKLLWRGIAEKTLSGKPEKNEKKLEDAVKDMFKRFPPPSKET